MLRRRWNSRSSFQIIILGFAFLIFAGTMLLMLPGAKAGPGHASFADALFTATSASCVTGLVVQDTGTYWSLFGQIVILALIQIGGMGIITVAMAIAILSGKKINLVQRNLMHDSIDAPQMSGIIRLTRFILSFTVITEGAGALMLMPVFIREFGPGKGTWYAVFHSISAFCNAGFDLMGVREPYGSLKSFASDPLLNFTIMALIVTGGLGFLVWYDVLSCRQHIHRWRMQTKVVIFMTTILIIGPSLFFYFFEYTTGGHKLRVLYSLFQSVTTRTAGFNTADLTNLDSAGVLLMTVLMLTGGSPGSTAGGMKTTTVAVLFSNSFTVFRRKKDVNLFRRRLDEETNMRASALFLMYIFLFSVAGMIISVVEDIPVQTCLFETASAIGTVGLTLGITPGLTYLSRALLVALMYFGRVGGLTLIFAAVSGCRTTGRNPLEKLTVG